MYSHTEAANAQESRNGAFRTKMPNEEVKIHPGEKVTHISLYFRHLFSQSRCRGCVLHERLTHSSSLGCGGVIGEANQMPSLWVAGETLSIFCPFTHKLVRIPQCHLLRKKKRASGDSCQSLLAVKGTNQSIFINSFTHTHALLTVGCVSYIENIYVCGKEMSL